MCPDKDTETAVADPTPAGPAAPGVPDLPVQEAEEPEPPAQQEPPEGVSGTEPGEEPPEEQPGDPLEAFRAQVAEAVKEHPELEDELVGALSQERQDRLSGPDEQRTELDRERALRDTQDAERAVEAQYSQGLQYTVSQADGLADELAGNAKRGAEDIVAQRSENVDILDRDKLVERMNGNARMAASVGTTYGIQSLSVAMTAAFAAHPGSKYLTADDKQKLQDAGGKPTKEWAETYASVHMDAALRGAPAEVAKKADVKAKRDSNILDRVEKLKASLPTNGKAPKAGTSASQTPRDEQEARNWNATGKWSAAKLRAWLISQ